LHFSRKYPNGLLLELATLSEEIPEVESSAFAVVFYSVMIAVGFAVFENILYVGRIL